MNRMDAMVIEWDGQQVPDELRQLPPGRYVIERAADALTPAEDAGIAEALDQLDAGQGIDLADVLRAVRGRRR
jgi:hypothetical protein